LCYLAMSLLLLLTGCSAFDDNVHFNKGNLQKIKKIAITTYDEKSGVSVSVGGFNSRMHIPADGWVYVADTGFAGAVQGYYERIKGAKLKSVVGEWNFCNQLRNEFIEKLKTKQNYFDVVNGDSFVPKMIPEKISIGFTFGGGDPGKIIREYDSLVEKVSKEHGIDAIINLYLAFYGLSTGTSDSDEAIPGLMIEAEMILIPSNERAWRKTEGVFYREPIIDGTSTAYKKITFADYISTQVEKFKSAMDKDSSLVINKLLFDMGFDGIPQSDE
ncbi:MAG: hypothetical protein JXB42_11725, partial [Deltaproteobacteria bacterium]|nr:hypothetical protein [Deltaproteobacteria bacterium]